MANVFQGFLPRRVLVIGLFALASLGVACSSSVSSGGAAGGAGGKGEVGGGGAGGTGGAPAVPCVDPGAIKNGDPCNHPGEICGGAGTSCYPVIVCDNGAWNTSTVTCTAGSGGSFSAGSSGSSGGTGTTTTGTATATTGTGG